MHRKIAGHLHNFFIPHEGNDHKPHAVRHSSLWTYGALLVALKTVLVFALFTVFPDVAQFSSITQTRIAELVNQTRREHGLASVRINPVLQQAAQLKLNDMISDNYFAHNSPDGYEPWHWFKQAGYLYTYAGENLAMNFIEAEDVHTAWLASPTHRANIVSPNYQEIGVAVGIGEIDGYESTLVVQMFGTSFAPPKVVDPVPAPEPTPVVVKGEETAAPAPVPEPTPAPRPTEVALLEAPDSEHGAAMVVPTPDPVTVDTGDPLPLEEPAGSIDERAGVQEVTFVEPGPQGVSRILVKYTRAIPYIILIFIFAALLMKILIRYNIQHRKIIVHAIVIILLGLVLIFLNFHFLEPVTGPVIVK